MLRKGEDLEVAKATADVPGFVPSGARAGTRWKYPSFRRGRSYYRPQSVRSRFGTVAYALTATVIGAVFLAPLVWPVLRSFQPASLVDAAPSGADFTHFTLANYRGLLGGQVDILRYVGNSLLVAAATALLTSGVSVLAGYGFGRFKFRGQALVFFLILLTLMLPFQAMLTPLFLEMHVAHLTNSLLGLILLYTAFNLPFGVFLMRNSFRAIPQEVEESAIVDGASVWKVLLKVLRPFVAPGVATTLIYSFLFSWTEFLAAVTFLTSPSQFTLPVALLNVETGTFGSVNYGFLEAGAVIAMVPCVVLYILLQRYYIEGLASGAVKG